jgi:Polyketide cyclase / dehydrase and lipid transport
MLSFAESAACRAPAEEVWALLYDPARYTEWWEGTERSEPVAGGTVRYRSSSPSVPVPTRIRAEAECARVMISCQIADVEWEWALEPADAGCRVRLDVRLSEEEADSFEKLRRDMRTSIGRLVAAAERAAATG